MGYLNNTTRTLDAILTKRGREILSGGGTFNVTKFALGDDEVDYSLYDESLSANFRGRVIENMPLVEGFLNQQEIMNYFMTDAPDVAVGFALSNIPNTIDLTGKGDTMVLSPTTENLEGTEMYEFILEHDNLCEIYDANNAPIANFMFEVSDQGSLPDGSPPIANFNWVNSGLMP